METNLEYKQGEIIIKLCLTTPDKNSAWGYALPNEQIKKYY